MLKPVTSEVPCENLISRLNKNSCFDRGSHPVHDALRVLGNYFVGENKTKRRREKERKERREGERERGKKAKRRTERWGRGGRKGSSVLGVFPL